MECMVGLALEVVVVQLQMVVITVVEVGAHTLGETMVVAQQSSAAPLQMPAHSMGGKLVQETAEAALKLDVGEEIAGCWEEDIAALLGPAGYKTATMEV